MASVKVKKVQCSDWMDSWGLGTNKIGHLVVGPLTHSYIWTGIAQGRHGQILRKKYSVHFTCSPTTGEIKIIEGDHALPTGKHIENAIKELNAHSFIN